MHLAGWQYGVAASLLGSLCGTLGAQLRIRSLMCCWPHSASLQVAGWSSWLFGQGMVQVALVLAPATIAACVNFSGSLMCNALLAPLVLQEHLTLGHGMGVVLLTLGGTCVTLSSDHQSQEYTLAHLSSLWDRPVFLMTVAGCVVVILVLVLMACQQAQLNVWSFAFLFALCGSFDLLVAKYTLQLLRLCVEGRHLSTLPPATLVLAYTLLMLGLHVATFLFQVASAYYTKALESMPLILGSGCMVQVCLCGIFFEEFSKFTSLSASIFVLGLGLVLVGMVITSQSVMGKSHSTRVLPGMTESLTEEPQSEIVLPASLAKVSGQNQTLRHTAEGGNLLKSPDLLLLADIQRSELLFGTERCKLPELPGFARNPPVGLRRFVSAPLFRPLLMVENVGRSASWDTSASEPSLHSVSMCGQAFAGELSSRATLGEILEPSSPPSRRSSGGLPSNSVFRM